MLMLKCYKVNAVYFYAIISTARMYTHTYIHIYIHIYIHTSIYPYIYSYCTVPSVDEDKVYMYIRQVGRMVYDRGD